MKLRSNKIIDFPDVCILKASYKPTLVQPKKYLGDKVAHDRRNRFTITISLKDDIERIDFLRWWSVDLEYGIFPFNITLPIFGKDYKIQAQLINDLSSMEKSGALETTLELEQLGLIVGDGIVLSDIISTGSNSCVILYGATTCRIENTLSANVSGNPTGTISYVWTVTGAVIKSGQGTGNIVIESKSHTTSNIYAELKVADGKNSMTRDISITHTRVHPITYVPVYKMTEDIVNSNGFSWVVDSSPSNLNGKLLESDGVTPYHPTATQYPKDGVIDLSGGRSIDTGWIASSDKEWTMTGVYDVVMGTSYKIYAIHYKGNGNCDIYSGDNNTPLALKYSNKVYTPPIVNWIIKEDPPTVVKNPSQVTYIQFDEYGLVPNGFIVNPITKLDFSDAPADYLDSNGDPTGISTTMVKPFNRWSSGVDAHAAKCAMDISLLKKCFEDTTSLELQFNITLPPGTYTIKVLASTYHAGNLRITHYDLDGNKDWIDAGADEHGYHCVEWKAISGGRTIEFKTQNKNGAAYLSAMKITKV